MNTSWNGKYYKEHAFIQTENALRTLKEYPLGKAEIILDVGCGIGNITKELALKVPRGRVMGIDSSIEMLRCAWKEYREVSNLEFMHKRAEDLDLSISFDLITSFNAFHFISDHRRVLERFTLHLRPGGRLLLLLSPKMNSITKATLRKEPWNSMVSVEKKLHYKTFDEYHELITAAGFCKKRMEQISIWHSFATREEMLQFFMTYLPYASGLADKKAFALAVDIVDTHCEEQRCSTEIKMENTLLLVEAFLP